MADQFHGKTASQWIEALSSGDEYERCAAALALAELEPKREPAYSALLGALSDMEPSVQMSVQLAIGFVYIPDENRRRMFAGLMGADEYDRDTVLQSLTDLAFSKLEGTTSGPDKDLRMESETLPAATPEAALPSHVNAIQESPGKQDLAIDRPPPDVSPAAEPDIVTVHKMPWWFLCGIVVTGIGLAWFLRGLSESRWVTLGIGVVAGAFLFFTMPQAEGDLIRRKRFHSRARIAGAILVSAIIGGVVTFLFPTGSIMVENASPVDVQMFLDDEAWLSVGAGQWRRTSLPQRKYRVTIKSTRGEILDQHDIEVNDYGPYILNALGAQVYFDGVVKYGIQGGGSMKVITDKWFKRPKVDYLYADPPERIWTVNPVSKSYFTKGAPPKPKGDH